MIWTYHPLNGTNLETIHAAMAQLCSQQSRTIITSGAAAWRSPPDSRLGRVRGLLLAAGLSNQNSPAVADGPSPAAIHICALPLLDADRIMQGTRRRRHYAQ
jgi:hypothetical protein